MKDYKSQLQYEETERHARAINKLLASMSRITGDRFRMDYDAWWEAENSEQLLGGPYATSDYGVAECESAFKRYSKYISIVPDDLIPRCPSARIMLESIFAGLFIDQEKPWSPFGGVDDLKYALVLVRETNAVARPYLKQIGVYDALKKGVPEADVLA